jgi:hypothetical protein
VRGLGLKKTDKNREALCWRTSLFFGAVLTHAFPDSGKGGV